MASCLRVNFFKSSVVGINVSQDFMEMASNYLNCSEGSVLFCYLGLLAVENPKCLSTCEPLLD
jgi:hypothetical protein